VSKVEMKTLAKVFIQIQRDKEETWRKENYGSHNTHMYIAALREAGWTHECNSSKEHYEADRQLLASLESADLRAVYDQYVSDVMFDFFNSLVEEIKEDYPYLI